MQSQRLGSGWMEETHRIWLKNGNLGREADYGKRGNEKGTLIFPAAGSMHGYLHPFFRFRFQWIFLRIFLTYFQAIQHIPALFLPYEI